MLVTLYRLYLLACIGCQPVDTGRTFQTYEQCMRARPTQLDYCVREPNSWVDGR